MALWRMPWHMNTHTTCKTFMGCDFAIHIKSFMQIVWLVPFFCRQEK